MSLFDWFFPQQAQASHLRSLAQAHRGSARRRSVGGGKTQDRLKSLEEDLGYVTLVLGSILHKLDEKGLVKREDLRASMSELDSIDGAKDGKLDINILKGLNR